MKFEWKGKEYEAKILLLGDLNEMEIKLGKSFQQILRHFTEAEGGMRLSELIALIGIILRRAGVDDATDEEVKKLPFNHPLVAAQLGPLMMAAAGIEAEAKTEDPFSPPASTPSGEPMAGESAT